jgi:hypothetical protein
MKSALRRGVSIPGSDWEFAWRENTRLGLGICLLTGKNAVTELRSARIPDASGNQLRKLLAGVRPLVPARPQPEPLVHYASIRSAPSIWSTVKSLWRDFSRTRFEGQPETKGLLSCRPLGPFQSPRNFCRPPSFTCEPL